jgi:vacuolar-type H+-ATPase subunit I/STV1
MAFALGNILLALFLVACLFAFLKGGAAERYGAAIILANLITYSINELSGQSQIVSLAIDALTAVLLLAVAIRYASIWLGAVMLLYALQFGLHGYYFVLEKPRDIAHVIINNTLFCGICLALVLGTLSNWRGRAAVSPADSPQPAP